MKLLACAAVAAILALPSVANATVTFDPNTSTGTVPRADIEAAYGGVSDEDYTAAFNTLFIAFYYDVSDSYYVTCEWDQQFGSRTIHRHSGYIASGTARYSIRWKVSLSGGIAGDVNLYGPPTLVSTSGDLPVVGGQCGPYGRGGGAALVTSVTPLSEGTGVIVTDFGGDNERTFNFVTPT